MNITWVIVWESRLLGSIWYIQALYENAVNQSPHDLYGNESLNIYSVERLCRKGYFSLKRYVWVFLCETLRMSPRKEHLGAKETSLVKYFHLSMSIEVRSSKPL